MGHAHSIYSDQVTYFDTNVCSSIHLFLPFYYLEINTIAGMSLKMDTKNYMVIYYFVRSYSTSHSKVVNF